MSGAGTLSGTEVCGFTGRDGVNDAQIALASEYITTQTGSTVDEHVDDRGIAVVSVRAAWSVVAARMSDELGAYTLDVLASESQGDYAYTNSSQAQLVTRDLLAGLPRQLLRISAATWTTAYGDGGTGRHPFWSDIDMQPDGFIR
jgi:hypothetical protein